MFVGILQFELLIRESQSLKDKRRIVQSLKNKLHREHQVSVAEVAALDHQKLAVLGLAVVSMAAPRCGVILDTIVEKLGKLPEARLGEYTRCVSSIEELAQTDLEADGTPTWQQREAYELAQRMLQEGDA
jgi:uncharacterized protein YlxP (DUF503 family)